MEKKQTTRAFIHFSKCRGLQQQNYKTFLAFKARNNADNLITQAKKPAPCQNRINKCHPERHLHRIVI